MTLDEFAQDLDATLIDFIGVWRLNHEKMPDQWPMEMDAGEWWEQFLAHITAIVEN